MKILLSIFTFILLHGQYASQHFGDTPGSSFLANGQLISAYPNPAKDFLYVKTLDPDLKIKDVIFYSVLGNVIADIPINSSYSEIRVDKFKPGKYLMRYILSDNSQKIIQITKQ